LEVTVPVATYNAWAADGIITFTADPTSTAINPTLCGGEGLTVSYSIASAGAPNLSGFYPVGTTTVEVCAVNANGIQSCCSFDVTVNDTEAPTILGCPGDQTFNLLPGECDVVFSYNLEATDNCPFAAPVQRTTVVNPNGTGFGQNGWYFDLTNTSGNTMTIDSVFVRLRVLNAAEDISVYVTTTANSYCGLEQAGVQFGSNANWTYLGTSTVTSLGLAALTPADVITNFDIMPGQTRGVLIAAGRQIAGGPLVGDLQIPSQGVTTTIPQNNALDANVFMESGVLSNLAGGAHFSGGNAYFNAGCSAEYSVLHVEFGYQLALGCTPGILSQVDGTGLTSGDRFPIGTTNQRWEVCDNEGNLGVCDFDVVVNSYPFATTTLACNDNVQVSLDEDGCTLVGADMILEGGPYGCYDEDYTVERIPSYSGTCGPLPYDGATWADCSDIGRTITVKVTDNETGSYCWGSIKVEDKLAPEIECVPFTITCAEEIIYDQLTQSTSQATVGPQPSYDASTQSFDVSVAAPPNATVLDVNATIQINHTWVSDLTVSVSSPQGTSVTLFANQCGTADDVDAVFDDEAPNPFACSGGTPTIGGNLRPQNPLSAFDGEAAAGTWTFTVADGAGGDPTNIVLLGLDVQWEGFYERPVATDNCQVISLTYLEDDTPGNCSVDGLIRRTWRAEDQSGNTATCVQEITVSRPSLDDVTFPGDFDGIDNPVLDCSSPYPDTGAAVCIKDTVLFEFQAPEFIINDGGSRRVGFDLPLPEGSRELKDINIRLDVEHPDVSQLQFFFQRLDVFGNVVEEVKLFDMNFNLGWLKCSEPNLRDMDFTFDDEGCALPHEPCVAWAPTIKGQFPGLEALSAFDGDLANGHAGPDWAIEVRDTVTGDAGRVRAIEAVYLYTDETAITTPLVSGNPFYNGDQCNLTRSYTDEVVDVCPTSYKVLRHWTVIDWCSGERRTHTQLIKVLDTCPPVVECPRTRDNDDDAMLVPVYTPAAAHAVHGTCVGHMTLPPLDVCYENCSGIEGWTTKLYSSDGSVLLGETNENGGNFRDIALDLDEGFDDLTFEEPDARYLVRYTVWDNCNNRTSVDVYIRVVDRVAPTPICREVTQLALTGSVGDTTTLCANTLDEGSYDNCSDVHFFLREMVMNQTPADIDPIGGPFGDAELNFEILGDSRAGGCADFKLANDYKFKSCIGFTCEDAGEDNQVFLLVVDDYVYNYINDYLNNVLPIFDAALNYNCFPLVILPKDRLDNEPGFDQLNGGERYWEFYLSENDLLPTAIIWEGHYNFCMVEVLVEDKVRPVCEAPDDVWTTCADIPANVDLTDTAQLQSLFGNATAWDNCIVNTEELSPIVDVDLCGVGSVRRRFRAEDNAGNISIGTCEQIIMIMEVHSYEIDIPGDFEDECTDVSPDTLEYREFGCDLLGVNVQEEEYPASALGECKKIFRTYKVVNWCEYDGVSDPIVIPRLDLNRDGEAGDGYTPSNPGSKYRSNYTLISNGDYVYLNVVQDPNTRLLPSTGYYEYTQQIKIFDDTAPELTDTLSGPFCGGDLDEDPCTGEVDLIPVIDETCTDVTVEWDLDAFSDTFNEADFSGENNLTGRYPLGTHTARFYVSDDCGNTSQIDITFDIIDCKAPTPVCYNGLSIDLMPSGMVELWASDFDASSYDYCHDYEVKINRIEDVNGDGFITADDYQTTPPTTDTIVARCKDLGILYVQMWVHELSGDGVNDWDYCVTFVEVQDNLGACTGSKVAVGGKITNEDNESVDNVNVELSTGASAMTGNDGEYVFSNLVKGDDYTVTPNRDDNPLNGVSTFDLVLISKHILNVQRLNSPYKVIAADANNSQTVTTLDLVALRKLILRVSNELPNNTSWRFVDKSHVFVDAQNPWNFPEVKNYNDLAVNELSSDFIAVKIGDVNGDAVPNSALGVGNRSFNGDLVFSASEQTVRAGDEFTVDFVANQNVLGYQFTLDYNEKAVELVDVVDGIAVEALNFNVDAANGLIATSWNEDKEIAGATMFSLVFRAKADAEVSSVLNVSSEMTAAEAYNANGDMMGVNLEFNGLESAADFALYQNVPNPFKGETVIGFNLPEASTVTLSISDATGKVIRVVDGDYAAGYNQVVVKRGDIGAASGVLSYTLTTGTDSATKQMIVVE
jgi:subtilisin-like proprotein convertase family protein